MCNWDKRKNQQGVGFSAIHLQRLQGMQLSRSAAWDDHKSFSEQSRQPVQIRSCSGLL